MSDTAISRHEQLWTTLTKAVEGENHLKSNVHAHEEEFATALHALPCPYPPEPLVRLYERSSALRPCVEAMATNVHAFGHRLVPRVDLAATDADKKIAEILLSQRVWNGDDDPADPSPAEVAVKRTEIERGMKIESIRLKTFFANCAPVGWTALRMMLSVDHEVTGNAYMEVVRDAAGRIARLNHCPAVNMRLRPLERDTVKVTRRVWVSDIDFEIEETSERPRGFVQQVNAERVYFKAFGDPRVVSARSGTPYASRELLPPGDDEATEIVHFAEHSLRSAYGVPRWIGATYEVLGIEAMSHVNYLGFDNKGIPPLAISVSGGTLTDDSVKYLENYVKTRVKGRQNYHALLILEATPTGTQTGMSGAQTRIDIKPLAQPQDAVYLTYADRCEDVIARQWRISPITRGKTKDFNRATADAAMKKDEEQVFQPQRQSFDERFERTILRDLGVRFHRVESNSPVASDPEALSKILEILIKGNVLLPNEGRKVASKILNEQLHEIKADWAQQPVALTIAGIPLQADVDPDAALNQVPGTDAPAPALTPNQVGATLQRVLTLRDTVRGAADESALAAEEKARAAEAGIVEETDEEIDGQMVHVVRVTPETMQKLVRANDVDAMAA